MIHIGKPIEMNEERFLKQLDELYQEALSEPEGKDIRKKVQEIVPTYVIQKPETGKNRKRSKKGRG